MAEITIKQGSGVSSTSRDRALFTDTRMGSIGSSIRELGGVTSEITKNAIEKRNQVVDTDYTTNSLVGTAEKSTRILQNMLESRKDVKGLADDYIKEYDDIVQEEIDNAPTEKSRNMLKRSYAQNRMHNFSRAFGIENQRIADGIVASSSANVDIIAERNFDNPEMFEENMSQLDMIFDNVSNVTDKAGQIEFEKQSKEKLADGAMRGLIDKDTDGAKKLVETSKFAEVVGYQKQLEYKQAIKSQEASLILEKERRTKVYRANKNDEFIDRGKNGTTPLSTKEVMESGLAAFGPGSKDIWYKRVEYGSSTGPGNAVAFNRSLDNINNVSEEDIYNLADPGLHNRPLNDQQLGSLLAHKRNKIDHTIKQWMIGVKPTITGSKGLIKDPVGEQHFMNMQFEAEGMLEEGKKAGLTAGDMFNPKGNSYHKYGGQLISKYSKSRKQLLAERTERVRKSQKTKELPPIQDALNKLIK